MSINLLINILANDKTKAALSGVQKNITNVKNTVFSLKGALVGLGAGAVIKSFVNVGKEAENLQVRFKFLFGSAEEGAIALDNLTKFAGRVPFSLQEIAAASGNLAVVAKDANDLNRILEITGNVAAVTGLDFQTTSSQIQRAFSGGIGAADLFRERGVRALLGFQNGAKVTAEETVKRFEELFAGDGQFANATKDLATTLEGTISMIGDKYFKFQKDVAAGFFDELKGEFGDLNTFLEENEQQIKDIATAIGENFAGALTTTSDLIKGVAPAVKNVADALGTTIEGFKSLPTFVQTSGLIAALLFGKKGAIAFGALSFLVGQIDDLIEKSKQAGDIELLNVDDLKKEADSLEKVNFYLDYFNNKLDPSITKSREKRDAIKEKVTALESLKDMYISNANELDFFDRILKNSTQSTDDATTSVSLFRQAQEESLEAGIKYAKGLTEQYEASKKLENFKKIYEEVVPALERLKEAYDPYFALQRQELEQIKLINQAKMNGLISDEEYEKLKTEITKKGIEDRKALREREVNEQLQIFKSGKFQELDITKLSEEQKKDFTIKAGREVLGALAKNNKKAFELNKALATAEAIVNTAQGVTKALASANYVQAILIGAMGAVQIATIQSQQYQGRAMGGPVQEGRPYLVGEQGPELMIPGTGGMIVPNKDLGGRQTVINFNITANDTTDFDKLLVKRRGLIVGLINNALNEKGQGALV